MVADNSPRDEQQANPADNITDTEGPKIVHRLPRVIRIGLDTVIKVKIISPERMKEVSPDSDVLDGLWHDRTLTIFVLNELDLEDRWEIFRHELLHAIHDLDREIRINTSSTDAAVVVSSAALPTLAPPQESAS